MKILVLFLLMFCSAVVAEESFKIVDALQSETSLVIGESDDPVLEDVIRVELIKGRVPIGRGPLVYIVDDAFQIPGANNKVVKVLRLEVRGVVRLGLEGDRASLVVLWKSQPRVCLENDSIAVKAAVADMTMDLVAAWHRLGNPKE